MTEQDVGSGALLGLWCIGAKGERNCVEARSAMWASWPAAGAAHAFVHLVYSYFDAALAGGILLGRSNPADPFVAR